MSTNLEFFDEAALVRDELDEVAAPIAMTYAEVTDNPSLNLEPVGTPMDYALGTDDET